MYLRKYITGFYNVSERLGGRGGYYEGTHIAVDTYDRSIYDVMGDAIHESGHHFYFYEIPNKIEQWELISNNSDVYVSEYAKTNSDEDFAESFEYVIVPCYDSEAAEYLDPLKKIYFDKYVKPEFREC